MTTNFISDQNRTVLFLDVRNYTALNNLLGVLRDDAERVDAISKHSSMGLGHGDSDKIADSWFEIQSNGVFRTDQRVAITLKTTTFYAVNSFLYGISGNVLLIESFNKSYHLHLHEEDVNHLASVWKNIHFSEEL